MQESKPTAQNQSSSLSIKESGAPPNATYLFHIFLDGRALLTNQSLSLPDSQKLREISRSFSSLFEQACRPEMDAGAEAALGAQLFRSSWPHPGRRSARRCPRAAPASWSSPRTPRRS